jgi:iron complex transport system ATP-binding protein
LAYGERLALDSLTLEFPARRMIGIVGPNGCGKSTLLSLLANLRQPTRGDVTLDGRSLTRYRRREIATRIAYLPQNPQCPRGLTVAQVLRYGRQPHQSLFRQFSREDAAKIGEVESLLQLGPIMERPMDELSGGQRQKAWMGMILAQDTDVVLLDEPTSALDMGHQHEVLECIRGACDRGKTVILVIHDLAAAARFSDGLLALKDGRIQAFGTPREVVRDDLVLSLYGLHAHITTSAATGGPVIVPLRRQTEATKP